ncbi:STM4012 family radical SAM protein [Acanthopleuribacter pedis]|uniref:STM4012 family radical SAM protein n=1 Tax=Acanthopleuribacter pedis TaxID=442870 RepID=A0A8J7QQ70_9BACT|nr:STM4012 family radical SAM protein [Acanthopleuribacter pedis]MBO1322613.1 STM4012 family radical SAM protein [Acanthopleuribacter pedis]
MNLATRANASKYQGYAYAYPHKSAYRALPRQELAAVWADEPLQQLFLYVHVPFCEMRCGFCNLFTLAGPQGDRVTAFLDALERQIAAVRPALGSTARFTRLALGGGTPSYLTAPQLERLFTLLDPFQLDYGKLPISFECSPGTITAEKVAVLQRYGVTRASIGVQSFAVEETRRLGRPQDPSELHRALGLLREAAFETLNLDLIYGIEGQTAETWRHSLAAALAYQPEELYLYPLYVRPRTGLDGRHDLIVSDHAFALYRQAVEHLTAAGYRRESMRLFRKGEVANEDGPLYCCQEDGMIGLGPGARSYTRNLHYCSEYAVSRPGVKAILQDYLMREQADFGWTDYGFQLNADERLRRYVIQSLGQRRGLDLSACRAWLGLDPLVTLPLLQEALALGWLARQGELLLPTESGLDHADVLAPALYSETVQERMGAFVVA